MCICFQASAGDNNALLQTVSTAWCSEDYNPSCMHARAHNAQLALVVAISSGHLPPLRACKHMNAQMLNFQELLGTYPWTRRAPLYQQIGFSSQPDLAKVLQTSRFGVTTNSMLVLLTAPGSHMCLRHIHLQMYEHPVLHRTITRMVPAALSSRQCRALLGLPRPLQTPEILPERLGVSHAATPGCISD